MNRQASRRTRRAWLSVDQIEASVEGALREAGLFPVEPARVDVEALLEVHLGASVDYTGDLPESILGYTLFEVPPRVVVNGRLTALALAPNAHGGMVGRWRATLAHEAAHIILHSAVMGPDRQSPHLTPAIIDETGVEQGRPEWLEVQANMGMAALLMPRAPFLEESRRALETRKVLLPLAAESLEAERLIAILAHRFATSREATYWRLRNLRWLTVV